MAKRDRDEEIKALNKRLEILRSPTRPLQRLVPRGPGGAQVRAEHRPKEEARIEQRLRALEREGKMRRDFDRSR